MTTKLYKSHDTKLSGLKKIKKKKEKYIQKLVENNLTELFSLTLVATEFALKRYRIDTLAINLKKKQLSIIEYKKSVNKGVIEQGLAYLSLIDENKDIFLEKINKTLQQSLEKREIKWEDTKLITVSGGLSTYQRSLLSFETLPVEMWTYDLYEDNIISFTQLKTLEKNQSKKPIATQFTKKDPALKQIADLFSEDKKAMWELYIIFRLKLLQQFKDLEESVLKSSITYKLQKQKIANAKVLKQHIVLSFTHKINKIHDPGFGLHKKNKIYIYKLHSKNQIDYVLFLIDQLIRLVKNI